MKKWPLGMVNVGLVLAFVATLVGCPSRPVVSPTPDADASAFGDTGSVPDAAMGVCEIACANLRANDCPEGWGTTGSQSCETTCGTALVRGYFDMKPVCIANARTAADIRACGTVRCQR